MPVAPFLLRSLTERDDKIAQGKIALGRSHANRPRLRGAGETLGDVKGRYLRRPRRVIVVR
jgi:hypothetical protein